MASVFLFLGMTIITDQLNKLKTVVKNINKIAREELIKERDFIVQLNRDQLLDGKKADGTSTPDYVDGSLQPFAPGAITLFDEEDFHAGLDTLFEDTAVEVVGTDPKTDMLVAKYGDILGLNDKSIILLQRRLQVRLQQRINAIFQ